MKKNRIKWFLIGVALGTMRILRYFYFVWLGSLGKKKGWRR